MNLIGFYISFLHIPAARPFLWFPLCLFFLLRIAVFVPLRFFRTRLVDVPVDLFVFLFVVPFQVQTGKLPG